jgi:predicted phosphate transport protein (TIGR00153 family)
MRLMNKLFGRSPFEDLLKHTQKVHECVQQVQPLMEACIREDYDEIHRLQDEVSRLEYEADVLKHEIREHLPSQYLMPVEKSDLDRFLHSQDNLADRAQDFAVILLLRRTRIHKELVQEFREFVGQVLKVVGLLMTAAEDIQNLVEASFKGAQARLILDRVSGLNTEEWNADRMQRKIAQHIYQLEKQLDPITIAFYEKMLQTLSGIANSSENTGDILRQMIVKKS